MATIESLLEDTGGCGIFQVLTSIFLLGSMTLGPWSLIFMAFGRYSPGWYCADSLNNISILSGSTIDDAALLNGTQLLSPFACDAYANCSNVVFSKESSTVTTEWNLICDKSWVINLIICLKMVGLLLGSLAAGWLNNLLGRKRTYYGTLVIEVLLNLISAFSNEWEMFAVLQLLQGITMGSIIITFLVYPIEFLNSKWRFVVGACPAWDIGAVTFATAAMTLRNWRHLQIANAVFASLWLLPAFWVPESIRWLTVKNKAGKALRVAGKMARVNGRKAFDAGVISGTIQRLEIEHRNQEKKGYSVLDLYRFNVLKKTIVINYTWFTLSLLSSTLIYNLSALSGDFYINLILYSSIPFIHLLIMPFLLNVLGRRLTGFILYGILSAGYVTLTAVYFSSATNDEKALATRVTTLIVMLTINIGWNLLGTYGPELFPTVLRSLSQGNASSVARISAIISPFLIPTTAEETYRFNIGMIVLCLIGFVSYFFVPETKGKPIADLMTMERNDNSDEQESPIVKEDPRT